MSNAIAAGQAFITRAISSSTNTKQIVPAVATRPSPLVTVEILRASG